MKTLMERYRRIQEEGAIGYMLMWFMGVPHRSCSSYFF